MVQKRYKYVFPLTWCVGKRQFSEPKKYGGYGDLPSVTPRTGPAVDRRYNIARSRFDSDKIPFILKGQDGRETPSTKMWISDIPISCDGADIESALVRLGYVLRSSLIFERIRNKDGKHTRFLTGRRFIFIDVPSKPLERSLRVGWFTTRLYRKEQPKNEKRSIVCSRCLQTGH